MKWRHLLHYKLETGEEPNAEYNKNAIGLWYDDGIAGQDAKRRFTVLNVYFFMNFYSQANPNSGLNMARLQTMVDKAAKSESGSIQQNIDQPSAHTQLVNSIDDIRNDILHRVFYYLYV